MGKKRKKGSGPQAAYKLPAALPVSKCKLRLLRLERLKDFLLLEEEFLSNQAARKPREQQDEEDKSKVDEIRGSPMSVGSIEEVIDEQHAIVSSPNGPEYYVRLNTTLQQTQRQRATGRDSGTKENGNADALLPVACVSCVCVRSTSCLSWTRIRSSLAAPSFCTTNR